MTAPRRKTTTRLANWRMLRSGLRVTGLLMTGLLVSGLLLTGLPARAETMPVSDFSAGPPNGVYAFPSRTPRTLPELLRGQGEAAQPVGHLFLPADTGQGKVGAVVFVHGSGGIYDAMLGHWPQAFNRAGIAYLALDMFGPRGVRSTAEDQSQVPFSADLADAYAALRLLATHPRIDPARIAVIGTSRGGIAAWRVAGTRLTASQKLPGGLRFAAHVMLYAGGCSGGFRHVVRAGVFGPAPMLWVHGEADDYTPIGACREYAGLIGQAGTPVEFVALPGAHHKFDSDDSRFILVRGAQRTREDCPLQFDVDSLGWSDRTTGERLSPEAMAEVNRSRCAALGAHVQGDRAARDEATRAVLDFLAKVYAR
ncbi:dienelactone hydrolase family protein [Leptothrix discophora]|uniref:Alpha/beta hydrolase fold domain-containing protein n=1 Tax=Leptothrix discophora TaxID=89 RepID=A0ABT9FXX3_LEPDI|nr:alpha/beta hydrolase fold domain-containing protein [Leptothrix discophora]MDP4299086.1 alpha/beta hydrolase fold domain-containing protein [Leptothrix discophora]